jgi:hypothetical protein
VTQRISAAASLQPRKRILSPCSFYPRCDSCSDIDGLNGSHVPNHVAQSPNDVRAMASKLNVLSGLVKSPLFCYQFGIFHISRISLHEGVFVSRKEGLKAKVISNSSLHKLGHPLSHPVLPLIPPKTQMQSISPQILRVTSRRQHPTIPYFSMCFTLHEA